MHLLTQSSLVVEWIYEWPSNSMNEWMNRGMNFGGVLFSMFLCRDLTAFEQITLGSSFFLPASPAFLSTPAFTKIHFGDALLFSLWFSVSPSTLIMRQLNGQTITLLVWNEGVISLLFIKTQGIKLKFCQPALFLNFILIKKKLNSVRSVECWY